MYSGLPSGRTYMRCPSVHDFIVCTVVQNCCKGVSRLVNGKPRFLDPHRSKTPEPIDIKLDRGDYVGYLTPHANFGISTIKGAGLHMREIVIIRVYFLHLRCLSCAPAQIALFDRFS